MTVSSCDTQVALASCLWLPLPSGLEQEQPRWSAAALEQGRPGATGVERVLSVRFRRPNVLC